VKGLLLSKFVVENFGVFRGRHVFDLRTIDNTKPIILFGGRNGTGKTTLFEGIRLCLYGVGSRGQRASRQDYQQYLGNRIHKRSGLAESEGASVALEFEHAHQGRLSTYFVQRSWGGSTVSNAEKLEIFRDGKPVDDVSSEQLQDFLIDLIPIGLSNLFFFDGEQIQKLAEDQPDNRGLVDAFNALLGMDVIDQLQTDLRIHLSRQSKRLDPSSNRSRDMLEEENMQVSTEVVSLKQDSAQKQTEIDQISAEIEREEHRLAAEGGGFSDRRSLFRSKQVDTGLEISRLEDALRNLASNLLPFAIAPGLTQALKKRLLEEERLQKELAARDLFRKALTMLERNLENTDFWAGIETNENSRTAIQERVLSALETLTPSVTVGLIPVHGLSSADLHKLVGWIDQSQGFVPMEVRNICSKLESKIRELRAIEEGLSRVPPDEAVSPMIRRLNELHEQLGKLKREMSLLDERTRHAEYKLTDTQRKIAKNIEQYDLAATSLQQIELGKQVQGALKEFAGSLRGEKIRAVSDRFVESFNQLSSKKNLISRIQIDPETFSTTLFRRSGTEVSREALSAGEKQVYAVAMLAALAKVSGKPLPFVIDTPLARLDSEHRTQLTIKFFPTASHQVIIFSTNSEIDLESFKGLRTFVSKTYLLQHNDSLECTDVSPGYFWESNLEVAA
jgi:DNA sulfur modification protein DndD